MNMGDYISDEGRKHLYKAQIAVREAKASMEAIRNDMAIANAWGEDDEDRYRVLLATFSVTTQSLLTLSMAKFYREPEGT